MSKRVILIGSILLNGVYGIGRGEQGKLAFRSSRDIEFFKRATKDSTVIMGRGTWQSLPEKRRPLVDRVNVVISNNPDFKLEKVDIDKGVTISRSIEQAIKDAKTEKVFVIGGPDMWYGSARFVNEILITHIGVEVDTTEKQFDSGGNEINYIYFSQLLHPEKDWPEFVLLSMVLGKEVQKNKETFDVSFWRYVRKNT